MSEGEHGRQSSAKSCLSCSPFFAEGAHFPPLTHGDEVALLHTQQTRQRATGGRVILASSGEVTVSSRVLGQMSTRSGLVTRRSKYFLCLLLRDVSVLFPLASRSVHSDVFYHLSSCLWVLLDSMTELFKICQSRAAERAQCGGRDTGAVQLPRLLSSKWELIELRFVEHQQSDLIYKAC